MICKFSDRLYADLMRNLNALALEEDQVIKRLERSVHNCLMYLKKLKDFCLEYQFTDKEEIRFFKEIKPRFKAQLIFHQTLLNIELRKPIGDIQVISEYYRNEIKVLQHFFESNLVFYQYVRTGGTYLDEQYYVRGKYDIHLDPDPCVIDFDASFSTTHDHKLAQVLANDLLQTHLNEAILRLQHKEVQSAGSEDLSDFDWKQTKVALIELIYSWHATEAFGKRSLKSIARFIERSFNVSLGNFYDTFDWLCSRQTPTLYIDEMKRAFLLRVEKKLR